MLRIFKVCLCIKVHNWDYLVGWPAHILSAHSAVGVSDLFPKQCLAGLLSVRPWHCCPWSSLEGQFSPRLANDTASELSSEWGEPRTKLREAPPVIGVASYSVCGQFQTVSPQPTWMVSVCLRTWHPRTCLEIEPRALCMLWWLRERGEVPEAGFLNSLENMQSFMAC